jgi:hypothetical protein
MTVGYVDLFICTEDYDGQLFLTASFPLGMVQLSAAAEGKSQVVYPLNRNLVKVKISPANTFFLKW